MVAADRTYAVPQENRTFAVPSGVRLSLVPAIPVLERIKYGDGIRWGDGSVWGQQITPDSDNYSQERLFVVPAESRTLVIPSESRIYTL